MNKLSPLFGLILVTTMTACSSSDGGGGDASNEGVGGEPGSNGTETGDPTRECESNADCADDEYCRSTAYTCGDPLFSTSCEPRPTDCSGAEPQMVCGCDGTIYESSCDAAAAGVNSPLYENTCTPPAGMSACGNTFCESFEACEEELEVSFTCVELDCDVETEGCDSCNPNPDACACEEVDGELDVDCTNFF